MPVVEASVTLSFLHQYQHVSGSKSETIDQFFVCHLIFWILLLHGGKCNLLSHIYVLRSSPGSPNFFVREPHKLLHNSSRDGHHT